MIHHLQGNHLDAVQDDWRRHSQEGPVAQRDTILSLRVVLVQRGTDTLQTAETIIVTMKTAGIVTPFYFTINPKLNWNMVEMTS